MWRGSICTITASGLEARMLFRNNHAGPANNYQGASDVSRIQERKKKKINNKKRKRTDGSSLGASASGVRQPWLGLAATGRLLRLASNREFRKIPSRINQNKP